MEIQQELPIATDPAPRAERIARLNDKLRRTGTGGRIVVTRGVRSLPTFNVATLLTALRDYGGFDAENDPHGERDFGDFEYAGASLFFKIDYYSPDLQWASSDPTDPADCLRILTVMLVDEY